MVVLANIIIPLYIYPVQNQNRWQKLTDAAIAYPDITFTAVVNPNSGPWPQADGCPVEEYITAINNLTTTPNKNIRTMGYVHTANRYDCGPYGNWICPCSRPIEEVKQEIAAYGNWSKLNCQKKGMAKRPDIHMDSLFIDEAPNLDGGANLTYMTELTKFAKLPSTGFVGGEEGVQVLFNAGYATEMEYFDVADIVVIMENDQKYYESIPDIDSLNGNGKYYNKSSVILYEVNGNVRRDTETNLSWKKNHFQSLYLTDRVGDGRQYVEFPTDKFWSLFLKEVDRVAKMNKAMLARRRMI